MKEEIIANYKIQDLEISEIVPIQIDGVKLNIMDGERSIVLPLTMASDTFKSWRSGPGGIFHKDIFLSLKERECGKYILLEGQGEKSILRLIEEDEKEIFETLNLIHGKVKDKPYMKLADLSKKAEKNIKPEYIAETETEELDETNSMSLKPNPIPLEDEEASSSRSISLFDD